MNPEEKRLKILDYLNQKKVWGDKQLSLQEFDDIYADDSKRSKVLDYLNQKKVWGDRQLELNEFDSIYFSQEGLGAEESVNKDTDQSTSSPEQEVVQQESTDPLQEPQQEDKSTYTLKQEADKKFMEENLAATKDNLTMLYNQVGEKNKEMLDIDAQIKETPSYDLKSMSSLLEKKDALAKEINDINSNISDQSPISVESIEDYISGKGQRDSDDYVNTGLISSGTLKPKGVANYRQEVIDAIAPLYYTGEDKQSMSDVIPNLMGVLGDNPNYNEKDKESIASILNQVKYGSMTQREAANYLTGISMGAYSRSETSDSKVVRGIRSLLAVPHKVGQNMFSSISDASAAQSIMENEDAANKKDEMLTILEQYNNGEISGSEYRNKLNTLEKEYEQEVNKTYAEYLAANPENYVINALQNRPMKGFVTDTDVAKIVDNTNASSVSLLSDEVTWNKVMSDFKDQKIDGDQALTSLGKIVAHNMYMSKESIAQSLIPYAGISTMALGAASDKWMDALTDLNYSNDDALAAGVVAGAVEAVSAKVENLIGTRAIGSITKGSAKALGDAATTEVKSIVNAIKTKNAKLKPALEGAAMEGAAEMGVQLSNNISDKYILGQEDKDIRDGVVESALTGAGLGGSMGTVEAVGNYANSSSLLKDNELYQQIVDLRDGIPKGDVNSEASVARQIDMIYNMNNGDVSKKDIAYIYENGLLPKRNKGAAEKSVLSSDVSDLYDETVGSTSDPVDTPDPVVTEDTKPSDPQDTTVDEVTEAPEATDSQEVTDTPEVISEQSETTGDTEEATETVVDEEVQDTNTTPEVEETPTTESTPDQETTTEVEDTVTEESTPDQETTTEEQVTPENNETPQDSQSPVDSDTLVSSAVNTYVEKDGKKGYIRQPETSDMGLYFVEDGGKGKSERIDNPARTLADNGLTPLAPKPIKDSDTKKMEALDYTGFRSKMKTKEHKSNMQQRLDRLKKTNRIPSDYGKIASKVLAKYRSASVNIKDSRTKAKEKAKSIYRNESTRTLNTFLRTFDSVRAIAKLTGAEVLIFPDTSSYRSYVKDKYGAKSAMGISGTNGSMFGLTGDILIDGSRNTLSETSSVIAHEGFHSLMSYMTSSLSPEARLQVAKSVAKEIDKLITDGVIRFNSEASRNQFVNWLRKYKLVERPEEVVVDVLARISTEDMFLDNYSAKSKAKWNEVFNNILDLINKYTGIDITFMKTEANANSNQMNFILNSLNIINGGMNQSQIEMAMATGSDIAKAIYENAAYESGSSSFNLKPKDGKYGKKNVVSRGQSNSVKKSITSDADAMESAMENAKAIYGERRSIDQKKAKAISNGTYAVLPLEYDSISDESIMLKGNGEIADSYNKMEGWLKSRGYSVNIGLDVDGYPSSSIVVPNMKAKDALDFALDFNLSSIKHSDGLILNDGTMIPAKGNAKDVEILYTAKNGEVKPMSFGKNYSGDPKPLMKDKSISPEVLSETMSDVVGANMYGSSGQNLRNLSKELLRLGNKRMSQVVNVIENFSSELRDLGVNVAFYYDSKSFNQDSKALAMSATSNVTLSNNNLSIDLSKATPKEVMDAAAEAIVGRDGQYGFEMMSKAKEPEPSSTDPFTIIVDRINDDMYSPSVKMSNSEKAELTSEEGMKKLMKYVGFINKTYDKYSDLGYLAGLDSTIVGTLMKRAGLSESQAVSILEATTGRRYASLKTSVKSKSGVAKIIIDTRDLLRNIASGDSSMSDRIIDNLIIADNKYGDDKSILLKKQQEVINRYRSRIAANNKDIAKLRDEIKKKKSQLKKIKNLGRIGIDSQSGKADKENLLNKIGDLEQKIVGLSSVNDSIKKYIDNINAYDVASSQKSRAQYNTAKVMSFMNDGYTDSSGNKRKSFIQQIHESVFGDKGGDGVRSLNNFSSILKAMHIEERMQRNMANIQSQISDLEKEIENVDSQLTASGMSIADADTLKKSIMKDINFLMDKLVSMDKHRKALKIQSDKILEKFDVLNNIKAFEDLYTEFKENVIDKANEALFKSGRINEASLEALREGKKNVGDAESAGKLADDRVKEIDKLTRSMDKTSKTYQKLMDERSKLVEYLSSAGQIDYNVNSEGWMYYIPMRIKEDSYINEVIIRKIAREQGISASALKGQVGNLEGSYDMDNSISSMSTQHNSRNESIYDALKGFIYKNNKRKKKESEPIMALKGQDFANLQDLTDPISQAISNAKFSFITAAKNESRNVMANLINEMNKITSAMGKESLGKVEGTYKDLNIAKVESPDNIKVRTMSDEIIRITKDIDLEGYSENQIKNLKLDYYDNGVIKSIIFSEATPETVELGRAYIAEQKGSYLSINNGFIKVVQQMSNMLRQAYTTLKVSFNVGNIFRDTGEAMSSFSYYENVATGAKGKNNITNVGKDFVNTFKTSMKMFGTYFKNGDEQFVEIPDGRGGKKKMSINMLKEEAARNGAKMSFTMLDNDMASNAIETINQNLMNMAEKKSTDKSKARNFVEQALKITYALTLQPFAFYTFLNKNKGWFKQLDKQNNSVAAALEYFGDAIDNHTRMTVYIMSRQRGATPTEAASMARNTTMDFEKAGSVTKGISDGYSTNAMDTSKVMKLVTSFFLFLKPAIQGIRKTAFKVGTPEGRTALALSAMFAAARIALLHNLTDEEEEKNIYNNGYLNENYYYVPVAYDVQLKVNKPYSMERIISNTMQRIYASSVGYTSDNAATITGDAFTDLYKMSNPLYGTGGIPSAFKPMAEISRNTKWNGAKILNDPHTITPEDNVTPYTPEAYQTLSAIFRNVGVENQALASPQGIEHLFKSYITDIGYMATANRIHRNMFDEAYKDYKKPDYEAIGYNGKDIFMNSLVKSMKFINVSNPTIDAAQNFYTLMDENTGNIRTENNKRVLLENINDSIEAMKDLDRFPKSNNKDENDKKRRTRNKKNISRTWRSWYKKNARYLDIDEVLDSMSKSTKEILNVDKEKLEKIRDESIEANKVFGRGEEE